jgi:hypothetical protein
MKTPVLLLVAAAALPLGACASTNHDMARADAPPGDVAPATYRSASAPECRSVGGTAAKGALIGGAGGAIIGAVAGGPLTGALIGAAVGGISGAVWADANNDGCVDGYVREGRYYEGAPSYSEPVVQPVTYRRGERG